MSETGKPTLSDDALLAAIQAMEPDRIQGFRYKAKDWTADNPKYVFVIRDVWREPAEQELWRRPDLTPADRKAFHRQCKIERMRLGVTAYLAEQPA